MIENLPIHEVHPCPTQPRRTYDQVKLDELTESIVSHGVLQPILVRPRPKGGYEIVFGERRYRGSKAAKLKTIPAVIREMSDEQVLEAQVVENDQREDVHPLDEADGYRALMERFGRSVEDIAAKVGKSRGYVYARLKLCELGEAGRKAYVEGKLTASTALYVARIPQDLQLKALERVTVTKWNGEQLSAREVAEILQDEFMLRLKGAPFPTDAVDLLEGVPSCESCPKRTGNQTELFADVGDADTCTDPACFKAKTDAAWTQKTEKHRQRGLQVLNDAGLVKKDRWSGRVYLTSKKYVAATDPVPGDKDGRTYKQVLGAAAVTHVARTPSGTAKELIAAKDIDEKLKEKGVKVAQNGSSSASPRAPSAANNRYERERRIRTRERARIAAAVGDAGAALTLRGHGVEAWRWLALQALRTELDNGCIEDTALGARLGIKSLDDQDDPKVWDNAEDLLAALPETELRAFVIEASVFWGGFMYDDAGLKQAAEYFNVDVAPIKAAARQEILAEEKAKQAAERAAAKKAKAKKAETKGNGASKKTTKRKGPTKRKAKAKASAAATEAI